MVDRTLSRMGLVCAAIAALIAVAAVVGCSQQPEGASTPEEAAIRFLNGVAAQDLAEVQDVAHGRWTEGEVRSERGRLLGSEDTVDIVDVEIWDFLDEVPDDILVGTFVHLPPPAPKREVTLFIRPTDSGGWAVDGVTVPVLEDPERFYE